MDISNWLSLYFFCADCVKFEVFPLHAAGALLIYSPLPLRQPATASRHAFCLFLPPHPICVPCPTQPAQTASAAKQGLDPSLASHLQTQPGVSFVKTSWRYCWNQSADLYSGQTFLKRMEGCMRAFMHYSRMVPPNSSLVVTPWHSQEPELRASFIVLQIIF